MVEIRILGIQEVPCHNDGIGEKEMFYGVSFEKLKRGWKVQT